ncbi:hypothetical protein M407DRAFT_21660 [Tulasnella calospora MUT 4182]|uniref:Tubulin-folding cofactor D ARM repeats domain-containing protein n=1 Tax=Tulasnella calospora MUT 4182 TaxID=1051891 RepID=A0A0C3QPJ1_9AGAM|nr:hypothetical protein M407DRAFT_21660 [Tulasnella calospora MUT 4182]
MDPALKASDDREEDRVQFSYFTRFEEYQKHSTRLLDIGEDPEQHDEAYDLYRRIAMILDSYQEQSYLLDPFLERMLMPPLQKFKERARRMVEGKASYDGKAWQGLPSLIYHLIKTRGAKTAVRFFPHTTEDLEVALAYLSTQDATASMNWETRYIVLLWLSLVAMLPFDLAQFDRGNPGSTFERLEAAGKTNLEKAGLEREGAALLLTRLYSRDQTTRSEQAIGTLHMLSETTKSGSGLKEADLAPMHNLLEAVRSNPVFTSNTLVRKWATKLEGRLGLCELPPPRARQAKGKHLQPTTDPSQGHGVHSAVDFDVPDTIENTIESLLTSLQDRDTVVRWSAAKGLARVAERLPEEYASQVLETVIGLFSIHAFDGAGGVQDLPPASEATWHGATLACAEIARRGLIGDEQLPELIDWLKRGLYFDIRKGAHSIGSNVRDAVCYVLWAMARAQTKESFRPFYLEMARRLVTVSVFDREVHVRRAASAAFQEHVGRMSLFPHGIDIIRQADFFAVSARRSAFTLAAPQVAEHDEYRDFLVNHLLTVSLKHWDPALRQPAAVALRKICEEDLLTLGPACAATVAVFLKSIDSNEVHGGLLALAEIADAYKQSKEPSTEAHRLQIFEYIVNTPPSVFSRYKNDLILEAACIGLANTLSKDALALANTKTPWKDIVMAGIKHRVEGVPEAAALAMRAASELFNCSAELER